MNVLIADDHRLTCTLLSNYINSLNDFDVVDIAFNGLETIKMISEKLIDIVILDISMPRLDGIQALRQIKNIKKDIKILMLSVHNEEWIVNKALQLGATGYISKKASLKELNIALNKVKEGKKYLSNDL